MASSPPQQKKNPIQSRNLQSFFFSGSSLPNKFAGTFQSFFKMPAGSLCKMVTQRESSTVLIMIGVVSEVSPMWNVSSRRTQNFAMAPSWILPSSIFRWNGNCTLLSVCPASETWAVYSKKLSLARGVSLFRLTAGLLLSLA